MSIYNTTVDKNWRNIAHSLTKTVGAMRNQQNMPVNKCQNHQKICQDCDGIRTKTFLLSQKQRQNIDNYVGFHLFWSEL